MAESTVSPGRFYQTPFKTCRLQRWLEKRYNGKRPPKDPLLTRRRYKDG